MWESIFFEKLLLCRAWNYAISMVFSLKVWSTEYIWKLLICTPSVGFWWCSIWVIQCGTYVAQTLAMTLQYHHELIGLKIFNVLQSTAVILFDAQIVHILASGSQFKLAPESFRHNPSSLWQLPCLQTSFYLHVDWLIKEF